LQASRLILAAALLAGCAALKPRPLDPGLFLLAPAGAGIEISLNQALTFIKGDKRYESLAMVQVDKGSVSVAGIGPLGNRMLTLHWDGKKLDEERDPGLPQELPARLMLRDLQLAYWGADSVKAALGRGWSLDDSPLARVISKGGSAVISIRYAGPDHWHERAIFEHLGLGYRLEVSPVQEDE